MAGIGGTAADLLALMQILDNSLETESSGADEARALIALVSAQHWYETLAAVLPKVHQSTVTLNTTAATETSTWSTSLRRLDAIWYVDSNGVPVRQLDRIWSVGGHLPPLPWPLDLLIASVIGGAPYGYYANASTVYWLPRPDAAYATRIYGFVKQAELTARTDNFNYPPECRIAFAQFAVRLMKIGVEDDTIELDKLAGQLFSPLLRSMRKFDRSEPMPRTYTRSHST